jgi:catechol 2,3-dioxygenase-like lactoylglutathione lyase family enzyme
MPLALDQPIGFIPTRNADTSRIFYEQTLGLQFVSDDQFALIFRIGPEPGLMLRVVRVPSFTPAPFTIFGWESRNIEQSVDELTAQGVAFLRFSFFEQDGRAIWKTPTGEKVAWFKDPDGNTLSLSQHTG